VESLDTGNEKEKLLYFAITWNDMDDETFYGLTRNLEDRRKINSKNFLMKTALFENDIAYNFTREKVKDLKKFKDYLNQTV